jgi:predicted  nucleic acid-binding Zn-ribbon protein
MAEQDQIELIGNVLNITRDQLTRSMNLNAELEALLTAERSKVSELEKQLAELTEKDSKDKK